MLTTLEISAFQVLKSGAGSPAWPHRDTPCPSTAVYVRNNCAVDNYGQRSCLVLLYIYLFVECCFLNALVLKKWFMLRNESTCFLWWATCLNGFSHKPHWPRCIRTVTLTSVFIRLGKTIFPFFYDKTHKVIIYLLYHFQVVVPVS